MAIASGDIKFYGSGASNIGGAIASELTDDSLHNLFDLVTEAEAESGQVVYRCVYVKNTSGTDSLDAAKAFISTNTTLTNNLIEIALGDVAINATETAIGSETTAPSITDTFASPVDWDNGKVIGTMTAGDYKAIWIKRTVIHFSEDGAPESCIFEVQGNGEVSATAYYDAVDALSPDARWLLDEASGTTAADDISTNDGTYGNFALGSTAEQTITYQDGGLVATGEGESVAFGGDSPSQETYCYARLPLPNTIVYEQEDWTISFILKTPTIATGYDLNSIISLHIDGSGYSSSSHFGAGLFHQGSSPDKKFNYYSAYSSVDPADNTTYQITIQNEYNSGTGEMTARLYVDSTLAREYTYGSPGSTVIDEIVIGCRQDADYSGFAGNYQDVAYWEGTVLSSTQIGALVDAKNGEGGDPVSNTLTLKWTNEGVTDPNGAYETYVSGLGPVRWYKTDAFTGSSPYNLEDFGSDLTNAIVAGSDNSVLQPRIVKEAPIGSSCVEIESYIRANNLFASDIYTVSFWIWQWPDNCYIFGANNGSGNGVQVSIADGDTLSFYYTLWSSDVSIDSSAPRMITISSDGDNVRLYMDGVDTGVTPVTNPSALDHCYIGADNDGNNSATPAWLDEILIFDYAMNASEVAELYEYSTTTNVAPPAPPAFELPQNGTVFVLALDAYDIAGDTNETHYFSTCGFTTSRDSTPADTSIPPTLKNPGNFSRSINLEDFGIVRPQTGEVVISNLKGDHDTLLTKSLDGKEATLYWGDKNDDFPGDFMTVMVSKVGGISYDYDTIKLRLRDELEFLNTPLLQNAFGGTGGADGDSSVADVPRQRDFGYSGFITAQLADASSLIYLVSDDYADDFNGTANYDWEQKYRFIAFDGGVPLVRNTDYTDETDMETNAPSAGEVRFLVASGNSVFFRLGTTPTYDVRVTTTTEGTTYLGTLISELPEITSSDGTILGNQMVNDPNVTYAQFIEHQAKANFFNVWTTREGAIESEIFGVALSESAVFDFNENNTFKVSFEQIIPAYKLTINYGKTYPGTYASGADDDIKQELSKPSYHGSYEYLDEDTQSDHTLARYLIINTDTYIYDADLSALATNYFNLYDERVIATVEIRGNLTSTLLDLDINDVVTLTYPRFGMDSGQKFRIIGVRHDFGRNVISFKLWG